jgi:hypothetical protein
MRDPGAFGIIDRRPARDQGTDSELMGLREIPPKTKGLVAFTILFRLPTACAVVSPT